MHERNRGNTTLGILQRLDGVGVVGASSLNAKQASHGLQVVFHAVVNLANRGILGDQFTLLAAQLGHIATKQNGAGASPVFINRNRAQRKRHRVGLDVGAPRRLAGDHHRQGLVDIHTAFLHLSGKLGQVGALEFARNTKLAESTEAVRAREHHVAVDVEF